jgi:hypothetical protein
MSMILSKGRFGKLTESEKPIERILLISLLNLTREGPVQRDLVRRDAGIPIGVLIRVLRKLLGAGIIKLKGEVIEASLDQRVEMAIYALKFGADFEGVCKALGWIEFENVAAVAFEAHGFEVKRRFRFKGAGRMWEMDLIGCRQPLMVCVDCKHWLHGWKTSAVWRTVDAQLMRTRALAENLPLLGEKLGLVQWRSASVIPAVLALVPSPFKFYNRVPIVPVLQLRDFLNELPAYANSLTHFTVRLGMDD